MSSSRLMPVGLSAASRSGAMAVLDAHLDAACDLLGHPGTAATARAEGLLWEAEDVLDRLSGHQCQPGAVARRLVGLADELRAHLSAAATLQSLDLADSAARVLRRAVDGTRKGLRSVAEEREQPGP